MGYKINNTERLFRGVRYHTKTTPELRKALKNKQEALAALMADRQTRVERICAEYKISDRRLADLILQYQNDNSDMVSYQNQAGSDESLVPAGIIANIIHEKEMTEPERNQTLKLALVLRNLRDTEPYTCPNTGRVATRECIHELTDHELEYLEF